MKQKIATPNPFESIYTMLKDISNQLEQIQLFLDNKGKKYITRKEASVYLRVSLSTIDRLVMSGQLTKIKVNSKTVFEIASLDNFLKRNINSNV